jgi:hypothetical protein
MPAGNTYVPIATTTLASVTQNLSFTSIPATYTDLVLVLSLRASTTASDAYFRYNNDSGTNYSDTVLRGNGSAASSVRDSNASGMDIGITAISTDAATFQTPTIIQIMNYANTTTYKTALIKTSNATAMVSAIVGLWRSTAAINEIDIVHRGTGWDIGSTASLYGIKAA